MIGSNTFALEQVDKEGPVYNILTMATQAGEQAEGLTRQLLAFSRRQVLQLQTVDLNKTVAHLNKMLRRLIGENIDLVTVPAEKLSKVEVDPGQIEQIIINLAVNARDAMPEGGKLTMELSDVELDHSYANRHVDVKPGQYVMFSMSDTGSGMDEETQRQIFDPFFTTKEMEKGTGLGLATVYGIVKQSGGHIQVFSELGKGTRFEIYLPRNESDEIKENEEEENSKMAHKGTEMILVVEDDQSVRAVCSRTLQEYGYGVLEAANGCEGIEVFKSHSDQIDLVLTDVVMPQKSGTDMVREIKPLHPALKVCYMSGYVDNAVIRRDLQESGDVLIEKPFDPDRLAKYVRDVLQTEKGGA